MTVWSDDYGMCCGETEARQNAREYSRQRRQEQREFDLTIRCLFIGAGIIDKEWAVVGSIKDLDKIAGLEEVIYDNSLLHRY